MGDIIDFELNGGKGKAVDSFAMADADFEEASKRLKDSQDKETLKEFLKAMGGLAKEAFENPYLKELMDGADELYKEFRKRYEDIFHSGDRHYFGISPIFIFCLIMPIRIMPGSIKNRKNRILLPEG
ncbi:MAG: hypothetical protein NC398_07240 [Acetatifactor muris]|nr:hypothetical protein [Acetatifactor muris]